MKLDLVFVSDIDNNRVVAEITCKRWYKRLWEDVAFVYLNGGEFVVEPREKFQESEKVRKLIERAKSGLLEYEKPEGVEYEEGTTRAGAAMELMLKKDGTSMGVKIGL